MATLALLALSSISDAALNIGVEAPDDMVRQLRQSVFVETAYLEERAEERCSSLDGPRCLAALLGFASQPGSSVAPLDGDGFVPSLLLRELGAKDAELEIDLPEYHSLEGFRRRMSAMAGVSSLPSLADAEAAAELREARVGAQRGVLHFAGLEPDRRVPLSFSSGLPGGTVATWDGRWVAQYCGAGAGTSNPPAASLPGAMGQGKEARTWDPLAPALLAPPPAVPAKASLGAAFVSAGLSGSVGYLRFSRPVLVRSLLARWRPPPGTAPAVVGGRLGLEGVWTTHLDPDRLHEGNAWLDISGDPLRPVDEVAFLGASGLEVGAVEVVSHLDREERTVLLLEPMPQAESEKDGEPQSPKFTLKMGRLSPAAAPYVVSLQEAIDRSLRLRQEPALLPGRPAADTRVPGLLNSRSRIDFGEADDEVIEEAAAASEAEGLLQHRVFGPMLLAGRQGTVAVGDHMVSPVIADIANLLQTPPKQLPEDLRRRLQEEKGEVLEALAEWIRQGGGSWGHATPMIQPQGDNDEVFQRFALAKRRQTKLDLLSAALLQLRPRRRLAGGAATGTTRQR